MHSKRDSRMQRAKNLQYKSKGRPRQSHPVTPVDTTGVEAEAGMSSGPDAADFQRSNLGSNWDRYAEAEEANVAQSDALPEGGAVSKQSEGLDYSALLEEADALLSSGGAFLLKHYEVDLDEEDPFYPSGTVEEPLPLHIDLASLNDALLSLSMAERLGLEEELFVDPEKAFSRGDRPLSSARSEDVEQSVSEGDSRERIRKERGTTERGLDELREAAVRPNRQESLAPETAPQPPDMQLTSNKDPLYSTQSQPGPPLDSKKLGAREQHDNSVGSFVPSPPPTGIRTPGVRNQDRKGQSDSEQPTTGPERDEDEDLLDLLLGGNDRPRASQANKKLSATSASVEEEHVAVLDGLGRSGVSKREEGSESSGHPLESRPTSGRQIGASKGALPSGSANNGSTMQGEQGNRRGEQASKNLASDQDFDSWLESIG